MSAAHDGVAEKVSRTRWSGDGPNDSVSSISILLDWLTTHGNYARWRGNETLSGETKTVIASQIAMQIQQSGVLTTCKPEDIISMIQRLEQGYRNAVDFLDHTRSGITDEAALTTAIKEQCPYYDILKGVFGERPSSRPLVTNEDPRFTGSDTDISDSSTVNHNIGEHKSRKAKKGAHTSHSKQVPKKTAKHRTPTPNAHPITTTTSVTDWSELRTALTRTRASELTANTKHRHKKIKLRQDQFEHLKKSDERRLMMESESKLRVQLLRIQVKKEVCLARREAMLLKTDIARYRKLLRDEGVPDAEIDALFPLPAT